MIASPPAVNCEMTPLLFISSATAGRGIHQKEEMRKGGRRSFMAVTDFGVSWHRFPAAPLAGF